MLLSVLESNWISLAAGKALELGGINTVKEECREARGLRGFDALERECRYAARQLRRNPGFAGTVVLTLALAVGANTPHPAELDALSAGEVGFVVANIKTVADARVGDTMLSGEVTREENDPIQRLRRVAVKIEGDGARGILMSLLKQ